MTWNTFWPEPEWNEYGFPDFSAIIMAGTPGWPYPPCKMSKLKILNNTITYLNPESYATERIYGISLGFGHAGNAEALLEYVEIIGNTITQPYSSGIYINATMKNIKIAGNNIVDPDLTQTRDDLKCAIKLEGRMQDVIIEKNIIKDNQLPHVLRSLIYDACSNLGGCI